MPGTLLIHRRDPRDLKVRNLLVYLDEYDQKTLSFEETLTLEVLAGIHSLKVTNGLAQQVVEFSIEDGEIVEYMAVSQFMDRFISPFLFILGGSMLGKVILKRIESA